MRAVITLALASCVAGSAFDAYKAQFGRVYTGSEEQKARDCFNQNLGVINALNAQPGAGKHGINDFTDICPEEFNARFLNYRPNQNRTKNYLPLVGADTLAKVKATASVDWRTKGAVTAVKNQAQCGSCWAFSATGNMEGQWFLAGNPLVSLSEQELVSCSGSAGNMGCNGGLMDYAFTWVIQNGGIASEARYPYTSGGGITGTCKPALEKPIAAKFSSYNDLAHDEDQMAAFVLASGPLSIAVDAESGWQTYTGGIVSTCTGRSLDHGVLIVGFGTDATSGTDYWIVKNSWAASWGEQGYIRLAKGSNQCGLNLDPSTIVA